MSLNLNIEQTIAPGAAFEQPFTTSTPAGEGNPIAIALTFAGDASICIVDANGDAMIVPAATAQPGQTGGRVQGEYIEGGCPDCHYTLRITSVNGATVNGTLTYA